MKFFVKPPLFLLLLTLGAFSYADFPGTSILNGYNDSFLGGKMIRTYESTRKIETSRWQVAVIENSVKGQVPTCKYSTNNNKWKNSRGLAISEAKRPAYGYQDGYGYIIEPEKILWRSCIGRAEELTNNTHYFFHENAGHKLFGDVYVAIVNKVILPLQKKNGNLIQNRPKVIEWKLF